jgi:hypothetical protein
MIVRLIYVLCILAPFSNLGTANASARQTLLACLGVEEWNFHKAKDTGPEYRLNQQFLNELSSLQEVQLHERYFESVCKNGQFAPSVNLLRALLVYGTGIFTNRGLPDETQSFKEMRLSGLRTLEQESPHLFFNYLAQKQVQISYPHCFRDKLPELQEFIDNYLYLEEDLEYTQLIADKDKIRKIFDHLRNFDLIRRECQSIQENLDSKRNLNTRR